MKLSQPNQQGMTQDFPYTFISKKKKYVAIAFPKNDLEWLSEHLTIWGEGEPYDFMTMHMEIAKEVAERIIEPAMIELKNSTLSTKTKRKLR